MLTAIRDSYSKAVEEVKGLNLSQLRTQQHELNQRIRRLDAEIAEIDEALKQVEKLVIADARVIATTLTRAYLRDSIQSRRFDTVILDEASMAPIPALWVAASLADKNAVVVGDFKQLPPIVLSESELAKKWLGRDIFEVAELTDPLTAPPHFIALRTQYRMHPQISAIPNELIYGGGLNDGANTNDDDYLATWYQHSWGHDHPVLLVDTGPVHAWVTSVSRGARSSRLNFLSATICVDLAEQLLRDDRKELKPDEQRRILIISPYRPHAQLLDLLIREQKLSDDVTAGTVHSFQGSEADVVILDLVNDEPHWRVAMFIPDFDETTRRLLNVALTRARHRLIVVGDFDYISKHARKAFVGSKLIPFLRDRYPVINPLDVLPEGLTARAAKAQAAGFGGTVEPDHDRLVVTQDHFFQFLSGDLSRAQNRVVIFSPFITQDRLSLIAPQIQAAVDRNVRVYVVTKARSDRKKTELSTYRYLEQALEDWGIVVVHKRGMHEKLVFVDDNILWSGSLNPLSYSSTQEIMERRANTAVVENYAGTLRLDDLLSEYDGGQPKCPICKLEIVASEGNKEPFYWLCTNTDCEYARSVDEPPLEGDIITCRNCGAPVEYAERAGKPVWKCTENGRHWRKLARTHLMLPGMRKTVPKDDLGLLMRRFGLEHPNGGSNQGK